MRERSRNSAFQGVFRGSARWLVALALATLCVGPGCAKPAVRVIIDSERELAAYRTWNWLPRESLPVAALGEERVTLHREAVARIERELTALGLVHRKDEPDLLVTYQLIVQREQRRVTVQKARQTMFSGRVNVPNINVDPVEVVQRNYDHGDLVIGVADAQSGRLLFGGRIEHSVRGSFEAHLAYAVARVLERFEPDGVRTRELDGAENERLLAALEASFSDRPPLLPQEQRLWQSGPSELPVRRFDSSGPLRSGPHW